MPSEIWCGNLKKGNQLESPDVDGRKLLKRGGVN
jgi:hypothetical protein